MSDQKLSKEDILETFRAHPEILKEVACEILESASTQDLNRAMEGAFEKSASKHREFLKDTSTTIVKAIGLIVFLILGFCVWFFGDSKIDIEKQLENKITKVDKLLETKLEGVDKQLKQSVDKEIIEYKVNTEAMGKFDTLINLKSNQLINEYTESITRQIEQIAKDITKEFKQINEDKIKEFSKKIDDEIIPDFSQNIQTIANKAGKLAKNEISGSVKLSVTAHTEPIIKERLKDIISNPLESFKVPLGTIIASMIEPGKISPEWKLADGSTLSSDYKEYIQITGTSKLPDLRGYFLRGMNVNGGVDPVKNRKVGSIQEDEFKAHRHNHSDFVNSGHGSVVGSSNTRGGKHGNENVSTDLAGGEETRPRNVAVYYYIKVK